MTLWAICFVAFIACSETAVAAVMQPRCDAMTASPGTIGHDVTILVCMKEMPGVKALRKMMKSVPPEVEVLYVAFNPTTSTEINDEIAAVDAEFANFRILPNAPPYSNIGGARRYALGEGFVKTKYFLSVENIAFFQVDFIQDIYDKAEAVRAEEELQGRATSVAFVPKMLEVCDEDVSMWSRRINQSHIMFDPELFHWGPTDTTFFTAGNIDRVTVQLFADDDGDGEGFRRFQAWQATLPEELEDTGVPDTKYIHFVEDHVYLAETRFYLDHLEEICLTDAMWKDDHFYLAAVPMFYDRGVVLVNKVAHMHWFCEWSLEIMHVIGWRRLEAHMITSCQLQEAVFGVSQAAQNCWEWMNLYKSVLFDAISEPNVQEYPAYQPETPLSSLRNANLVMASLLFSSHNEFQLSTERLSTEWLAATDALSELNRILRQPRSEGVGERLYVSPRKRYVDVFSEEYQEKVRVPSMPGTYQRHLKMTSMLPETFDRLKNGLVLDLPSYRLYHTGPLARSSIPDDYLAKLLRSSTVIIEYVDEGKTDFITRIACVECSPTVGALKLVTPEERIRIPAFDGDRDVRVTTFSLKLLKLP